MAASHLAVHTHLPRSHFLSLLCAFNGLQLKEDIVRLSLRHGSCSEKSTSSDCRTSVVKEHKRVDREALRMDSGEPGLYSGLAPIKELAH